MTSLQTAEEDKEESQEVTANLATVKEQQNQNIFFSLLKTNEKQQLRFFLLTQYFILAF